MASVFTAELTAMVRVLELVAESDMENFVIYTDCKSTLEAIQKYNSFHPLIL